MTIERTLAEWAANTPDQHSEVAQTAAQEAFTDTIACMVAGSVEEVTRSVREVSAASGSGKALAIGSSLRLPAAWAAFVGGTAAHALDFDDNFAPAATHASAVLAPALFALADERQVSGEDVIDAYIIGLELQARIGLMVNPGHYEKGWHATSTVGAIGTAGGCARLLGLDANQMLAAMSIAFSMASGSRKQFGSTMKPVHAGLAAKSAVLAALMAEAGISANAEPLTGRWGFATLYAGECDQAISEGGALRGLGQHLAIETDGLMAKRFPCCGAAHRTLDGLLELRERHQFTTEMVDHVDAFIPAFARENLRFDDPRDGDEARFSLTYCATRVVQAGRLTLEDMTLDRVRDISIRPWFRRLFVHTKPGSVFDEVREHATPTITRVVLTNGRVHEVGVRMPRGSRDAPFTEDEQRDKFHDCCRWGGQQDQADRLLDLTRSILTVRRFSEFSRNFSQYFL